MSEYCGTEETAPQKLPRLIIPQSAPACWLVSLFFTYFFWDRTALVSSQLPNNADDEDRTLEVLDSLSPYLSIKPQYRSFDEMYNAIKDFLNEDPQRKMAYEATLTAIASGELRTTQAEIKERSKTGSSIESNEINSCGFLLWAEKNIGPLPDALIPAAKILIEMDFYQKQAKEKWEATYPSISQEQFATLLKEPLWSIGDSILYLFGRKNITSSKKAVEDFIKGNSPAEKLLGYIRDAIAAKKLEVTSLLESSQPQGMLVISSWAGEDFLSKKVIPTSLLTLAKTLPIDLPILTESPSIISPNAFMSFTPEMQLMLDAAEKFWSPTSEATKKMRMKISIVEWIIETAKERNINISPTLARAMDTIIRPLDARSGGHTGYDD